VISNQDERPTHQYKVFLSYGHDPACVELANRLFNSLKAAGYSPWMDKPPDGQGGIAFNQDWRERIYSEIRDRSHMIALLSSHSTRKPGVCREEIALAIGPLNTRIYTVLVQPAEEVTPPLIVSRRQWLDMSTWRLEMEKGEEKFDLWYQDRFDEILRVLKGNANFSGNMEVLERWLQPNKQFSNRIEAEHGFTGREWLLAGIGESSLQSCEGDDDKYTSAAKTKEERPQMGEIERWAMSKDESRRVLWLCAPPGWGKSAVTARLAHAGGARVLAVHFCRYNERLTRDAREVIRSIAYQMATQLSDYRNALLGLLKVRGEQPLTDYSVSDLFHALIKEPVLGASLDGGRISEGRLLIVIDALDECIDPNGQSELLDLLSREFESLPNWIGLVMTSRPESAVIERFKKFGVFPLEAFSHENQTDLSVSLREWLNHRIQRGELEKEKADPMFHRLIQACQGNFQYLQTLKESIDRGIWVGDESHLPLGFADLYRQWFERQFSTAADFDANARPLLEWMGSVREPLTKGLLEQLEPDVRRRKHTRKKLGAMLVEDSENRLHFFHKSLADWLVDERQTGDKWIIDARAGHTALAATMAQQWDVDHHSGSGHFFRTWSQDARTYAMRHFPAHLSLSLGLDSPELSEILTDFNFALDRCEYGAAGYMLEDLLSSRHQHSSPELQAWRQCMAVSGHLLRQASLGGTAHQVLIQLALERPEGDPLHKAAQAAISRRPVSWPRLLREQASTDPSGLALAIDLGTLVASDVKVIEGASSSVRVQSINVHWQSRRLAVALAQADIMLFDMRSGLRIHQFDAQQSRCQRIQLSPAGDRLVTLLDNANRSPRQLADTSGSMEPNSLILKVWSLVGEKPYPLLFSTTLPAGRTRSLDFDAEGCIRVAYLTGEVLKVDPAGHVCDRQEKMSEREMVAPTCLTAPIHLRVSSADGSIHSFVCKDGSLWRFWTTTGQCSRLEDPTIEPSGADIANDDRRAQAIYDLAMSADGRFTAAVGEDRRLRVWRGTTLVQAQMAHAFRATRVCLSPGAREALTTGDDGKLHLWDLSAPHIQAAASEVTALAEINTDGGGALRIASGDQQGVICIRDAATLAPLPSLSWQAHSARIWDLIATHCGAWLVSAGEDGKICIWDAKSGDCVAKYIPDSRRQQACHALAISPDGGMLVMAAGALIEAWDLPETIKRGAFMQPQWRQPTKELHHGKVRALCFLSNELLVSAGSDSQAFVLAAQDGSVLSKLDHWSARAQDKATYSANTQGLYCLARSACGRFMACAGRGLDRAITIWNLTDPAQPRLINVLHGHLRGTHFLAFTKDGEHLWSGSWDQTLALWNWQSATEQREWVRPIPRLSVASIDPASDRLFVGTAIGETYSLRLLEP
jgi:WD40 repeat protein